jgi:hypothetical protein
MSPAEKRALKRARREIFTTNTHRAYVLARLSPGALDDLQDARLEIRNMPAVGGGFLIGLGQWRRIPRHAYDKPRWRNL